MTDAPNEKFTVRIQKEFSQIKNQLFNSIIILLEIKQMSVLTEKALRNYNLWVGKKRISGRKYINSKHVKPLQSQHFSAEMQLTYSLRAEVIILAFSVKT